MADEEDIPLALRLRKKAQVEYAPAPKYVEPSKKASKEYKRNDKKAQSRLHSQVEQLVANKEKKKHSAHSKSAISDLRSLYDKNVRPYLGAIAFGVLTLLFFYLRIREEFYDHDRALALMQEGDDPFTVLEVGKNASFPEIRSSYLELSKKFHPDKNPNCTDCGTKFEQIRLAYQKLSDPKKREQLVQGTTDSSASGDKEDSPIPSETFSLTDTNFDWEVQKQDAWLIQVYTDWSSACWEVMSDWEKTYTEIGKYIPMGRINTAKESELSRRFSIYKVPTFLSYVNGKHTVFHGRPNSSNFTAFMLNSLRESVWRITDANYRIFFNENEDKVRVLLFANRDLAKLRLVFRSLARTYKNSMVMGEVSALDSPGLYQLYNATKDKPSLVFIKEKGVKPLRYNGQMTYTKLKSLFDEHKFQVVPRLSTANVDDLCARPDNTSCVIFFKDAAPEDKRQEIMNALRNASRSAADATVDHEEGGAVETHPFFVWTDIAKQQQLASLLNVSAGSDRYIVALDKNNMKALAYPGDSADSSELLLWAQSLKDDADHFKPLSGALYLTYEAPPINFRQVWRTVSPYITSFLVVVVIVLLWYAAYTYYLDAKESKLAESRARRITKTKASLGQKDVKAEKWRAIEEENRKQEERRQKERAEQEKIEAEKRQQQARAAAAAAAAEAKLNPSAPVFQPSTVNAAATAAAAAVKAPKAEKKKEEKKKEEPKKKEEKKKEEQPKKKEATPAPAAAAAAPAAPAPPTDDQLRRAIEKAVNEADLETAKRSTIRDAVAKAFAGADLSARHAWIGTQIDAAFARRLE